jgi:hypothetical protein
MSMPRIDARSRRATLGSFMSDPQKKATPMPNTFSVTVHHGAYLLLVARGAATLSDLRCLLELTATVTRNEHYRRVLVDMMSVEFVHGAGEDRGLGHQAARSLQHLSRVAFAVCRTFRQCSGAQIALQSGLDLQVFDSLPEASEWISHAGAGEARQMQESGRAVRRVMRFTSDPQRATGT